MDLVDRSCCVSVLAQYLNDLIKRFFVQFESTVHEHIIIDINIDLLSPNLENKCGLSRQAIHSGK